MSKLIILYMTIHNLINIDLEKINLSINTSNTRANVLRLVLSAPRTNITLHILLRTLQAKYGMLCLLMLYLLHLYMFLNYVWLVFV